MADKVKTKNPLALPEPELFGVEDAKILREGTPEEIIATAMKWGLSASQLKGFGVDLTGEGDSEINQRTREAMSARNSLRILIGSPETRSKGDAGVYKKVFGARQALPNIATFAIPGMRDGMAALEQLGGKEFTEAIHHLKGMGSLSDAEGSKLTAAATPLFAKDSNGAFLMSPKEAFGIMRDMQEGFLRYDKGLQADGKTPIDKKKLPEDHPYKYTDWKEGEPVAEHQSDIVEPETPEIDEVVEPELVPDEVVPELPTDDVLDEAAVEPVDEIDPLGLPVPEEVAGSDEPTEIILDNMTLSERNQIVNDAPPGTVLMFNGQRKVK